MLKLMAEGRGNQVIADALVISRRAVEKHAPSIFATLGLSPAPEARAVWSEARYGYRRSDLSGNQRGWWA